MHYQLLGDSGSERGQTLASAHALHPPTVKVRVFCAGWGSKSEIWDVPWYDGVHCSESSLRFEEPKGDEHRVKHKARVQRSELRKRVTSD